MSLDRLGDHLATACAEAQLAHGLAKRHAAHLESLHDRLTERGAAQLVASTRSLVRSLAQAASAYSGKRGLDIVQFEREVDRRAERARAALAAGNGGHHS